MTIVKRVGGAIRCEVGVGWREEARAKPSVAEGCRLIRCAASEVVTQMRLAEAEDEVMVRVQAR